MQQIFNHLPSKTIENKTDRKISWLKNLWTIAGPPFRPHQSGLDLYKSSIKNLNNFDAMILGATPELIDLTLSNRAKTITVLDISHDMIKVAPHFAKYNWDKVNFINEDWLTLKQEYVGTLDFIACDGGTIFLNWPTDWLSFFKVVHSYLKYGGIFVMKSQDMVSKYFNVSEVINTHLKNYEDSFYINGFAEMVSSLHVALFVGTQDENGILNKDLISKRLSAARNKLLSIFTNKDEIKLIDQFFYDMDPTINERAVVVSGPPANTVIEMLCEIGFSVDFLPLPKSHAPAPDVCYMLKAYKT